MAGAQKTSQFTPATSVSVNDEVPLLQGGVLKRVTVSKLTGNVDFGWVATGESWTFVSFNSSTRMGVVTVPSDATLKYTLGNRIRIQQTTGGVKYGIIHGISSTTLTIFFPAGTTLNNETITSPVYSALDTPQGFDKSPDNWSVESSLTTDHTQAFPTANTWYNLGSQSLGVGIGKWKIYGKHSHGVDRGGAGRVDHTTTISTSSSSESHPKLSGGMAASNTTFGAATSTVEETITLASAATLYSLIKTSGGTGSANNAFFFGSGSTFGGARVIRATSAYL